MTHFASELRQNPNMRLRSVLLRLHKGPTARCGRPEPLAHGQHRRRHRTRAPQATGVELPHGVGVELPHVHTKVELAQATGAELAMAVAAANARRGAAAARG